MNLKSFFKTKDIEIDYDKLANAIVKAQDKADKETIKQAVIEANDELKKREKEKPHSYSSEVLAFFASGLVFVLGGLFACCSIGLISYMKNNWNSLFKPVGSGIVFFCFIVLLVIAGFVMCYICIKSYKELKDSEDNQLLTNVLSSLSGFSAMIVAVVALIITFKK